jgi:hypothetical protein
MLNNIVPITRNSGEHVHAIYVLASGRTHVIQSPTRLEIGHL